VVAKASAHLRPPSTPDVHSLEPPIFNHLQRPEPPFSSGIRTITLTLAFHPVLSVTPVSHSTIIRFMTATRHFPVAGHGHTRMSLLMAPSLFLAPDCRHPTALLAKSNKNNNYPPLSRAPTIESPHRCLPIPNEPSSSRSNSFLRALCAFCAESPILISPSPRSDLSDLFVTASFSIACFPPITPQPSNRVPQTIFAQKVPGASSRDRYRTINTGPARPVVIVFCSTTKDAVCRLAPCSRTSA
jgi:hypothetical protein